MEQTEHHLCVEDSWVPDTEALNKENAVACSFEVEEPNTESCN
jgi:hypothetical protein